jgi:hypothetical protein
VDLLREQENRPKVVGIGKRVVKFHRVEEGRYQIRALFGNSWAFSTKARFFSPVLGSARLTAGVSGLA